MHKAIFHVFYPVFIILILSACKKKPEPAGSQFIWNSAEPLSVSLNMREKELAKKNLIPNFSFEEGRYVYEDSLKVSFVLPGWEKIGDNVYWTDIQNESEYQSHEAFNGLHAVKIVRRHSREADSQGEGIISDFIRVIDGKYKLSYYARLEQVEPHIPRMQTNLGDAVNVRILYFDKNKVIIKPDILNPANNNTADISFKAFSLSHNFYIDKLGWGRILGKTANYPFAEGYLPENTEYVKIFLGFRGNGAIWFDAVNFEFSEDNFSLAERINVLNNKKVDPRNELIPAPKHITDYSFEELRKTVNNRTVDPMILVPVNPGKEILELAGKLSVHLGMVLKEPNRKPVPVKIIRKLEPNMVVSSQLIFSLGKTQAYRENLNQLPVKDLVGKQQAYFINTVPAKRRLIIVEAIDKEGFDRALNTLIQLIRSEDMAYHHFDIVDYPDILTRAVILPMEQENKLNRMNKRINTLSDAGYNLIYLQEGENRTDLSLKNSAITKRYLTLAQEIKRSLPDKSFGISFLNMRFRKPERSESVSSSFKKQADNFNKILRDYLKAGFNKILITDEFIWDFLEMDMKSLSLNLLSHDNFDHFLYYSDYFLQLLQNQMKSSSGGGKLILYLPVISNNEELFEARGYASIYFRELSRYKNLIDGIIWEGPSELPVRIDFSESYHYKSINGFKTYLLFNDPSSNKYNTLRNSMEYPDPEIARTQNIFQGFNIEMGGTPEEMSFPSFFLVDTDVNYSFSQLRLLTAVDYMWNTGNYSPVESTWKALLRLYGKKNAFELVRYNEKYCELLHLCLLMEKGDKADPGQYKKAEEIIIELNVSWNEITKVLVEETKLLNDLSDIKNQVITRIYQIRKSGNSVK